MAQRKQILFLGRQDKDTGYLECVRIAESNNFDLVAIQDVKEVGPYIDKADYVFAGGYLVALEAFLAKKIVLVSFTNPLKKDYWLVHPMASEMGINGDIPKAFSKKAYDWAKGQTWNKLAEGYLALWKK